MTPRGLSYNKHLTHLGYDYHKKHLIHTYLIYKNLNKLHIYPLINCIFLILINKIQLIILYI